MSVRDELYAQLADWDLDLPRDLDDRTPLFATGLLDSVALFNLLLWVETRTGHPVDPARVDLAREWATIGDIVRFVEGGSAAGPAAAPAPLPASEGCRVVEFRAGLEADVAQLQTGLWSRDVDLNARYLDWKYRHNPYAAGEPRIFLVADGDAIVGMRGFWDSRWEIGAGVTPMLVADDLMIRADHRRRGLNRRLMDAAVERLRAAGPRWALSLNASPTNMLASLAMDWRSVGPLQPMQRRVGPAAANIGTVLRRLPLLWRLSTSLDSRPRFGADAFRSLGDPAPRIADMVALLERLPRDGRIRHVRDARYLQWRYANPLREYRFLHAGAGELEGYLALSRPVAASLAADLVAVADMEATSDDVSLSLLREATAQCRHLEVWTAGLGPGVLAGLHELGFAAVGGSGGVPGYPAMLIRSLSGGPDWHVDRVSVADIAAWDVRMLYSMRA